MQTILGKDNFFIEVWRIGRNGTKNKMHDFSELVRSTVICLVAIGMPRIFAVTLAAILDSVVVGLCAGLVIFGAAKIFWFIFKAFYKFRYGDTEIYPGLSPNQARIFIILISTSLWLSYCYGVYKWVEQGWIMSGGRHTYSDHPIFWATDPYYFIFQMFNVALMLAVLNSIFVKIIRQFLRPKL